MKIKMKTTKTLPKFFDISLFLSCDNHIGHLKMVKRIFWQKNLMRENFENKKDSCE